MVLRSRCGRLRDAWRAFYGVSWGKQYGYAPEPHFGHCERRVLSWLALGAVVIHLMLYTPHKRLRIRGARRSLGVSLRNSKSHRHGYRDSFF